MKKIPLLPAYFRLIGLVFVFIAIVLYSYDAVYEDTAFFVRTFVVINDTPFADKGFLEIMRVDIFLTLLLLSLLLGLAFIAFSKTRKEDEMIHSLRLYSWSWAVITALALGVLSTDFLYGVSFTVFAFLFAHLFLLIYIILFHCNLIKINRTYEE